jgi:DNA mismatch endonuclease, patch repair protein
MTAIMRANRSHNTAPERALRSALHCLGLRFRKDYRVEAAGLRTKVDVAFPRIRVAVFVDGCFWHQCPTHGTMPATNVEYWRAKLEHNVDRDRRLTKALEGEGWTVLRFWEHGSMVDAAESVARIVSRKRLDHAASNAS